MMMVAELALAYRSTPRVGAGRLDNAIAIVLSTWLTIFLIDFLKDLLSLEDTGDQS